MKKKSTQPQMFTTTELFGTFPAVSMSDPETITTSPPCEHFSTPVETKLVEAVTKPTEPETIVENIETTEPESETKFEPMPDEYATYCPEDNKLRLYIGRVPKDEYLKLKAEGWKALYKQREAGGGDFVATWTPQRKRTALKYSDIIYDEDMSPQERAADRAERFSEYREKRTGDATGHADRYDTGPSAHGFQSEKKAERAAAKHDRIGDRAVDAWGKAEYWQRRTAGVIRHALYKSTPGVRMGRIKDLEKNIRKHEAETKKETNRYELWLKYSQEPNPETKAKAVAALVSMDGGWREYEHPRAAELPDEAYAKTHKQSLYSLSKGEHPITTDEACALFLSNHSMPEKDDEWSLHYRMRLAYEQQMLAGQGGRLEQKEIELGGLFGGKLIIKISRSPATKRITSVDVIGPKVTSWTYKAKNIPGTEWAAYKFDTERYSPEYYKPPTPETLKQLEDFQKKVKATQADKPKCPLINPTLEDAEKLQAIWNKHERDPGTVLQMTQAAWSRVSGDSFCSVIITEHGTEKYQGNLMHKTSRHEILKVRKAQNGFSFRAADRVVVITDKPQKPIPWDAIAEARASEPTEESMSVKVKEIDAAINEAHGTGWEKVKEILTDAAYIGWVTIQSIHQVYWTDTGKKMLEKYSSLTTNEVKPPVKKLRGKSRGLDYTVNA